MDAVIHRATLEPIPLKALSVTLSPFWTLWTFRKPISGAILRVREPALASLTWRRSDSTISCSEANIRTIAAWRVTDGSFRALWNKDRTVFYGAWSWSRERSLRGTRRDFERRILKPSWPRRRIGRAWNTHSRSLRYR